jgi:hypothetical protein
MLPVPTPCMLRLPIHGYDCQLTCSSSGHVFGKMLTCICSDAWLEPHPSVGPTSITPGFFKMRMCRTSSQHLTRMLLSAPATQVAGGVDTGVERLGLARPQEQLDDQTRRFREQVRPRGWGLVIWCGSHAGCAACDGVCFCRGLSGCDPKAGL